MMISLPTVNINIPSKVAALTTGFIGKEISAYSWELRHQAMAGEINYSLMQGVGHPLGGGMIATSAMYLFFGKKMTELNKFLANTGLMVGAEFEDLMFDPNGVATLEDILAGMIGGGAVMGVQKLIEMYQTRK